MRGIQEHNAAEMIFKASEFNCKTTEWSELEAIIFFSTFTIINRSVPMIKAQPLTYAVPEYHFC